MSHTFSSLSLLLNNDIGINNCKVYNFLRHYKPQLVLFVKELIMKFGKEKFLVFFTNQTYENAKSVFGNDIDVLIKEFEKGR